MISVLIKVKIESPAHHLELIQLAKSESIEYNHLQNLFFVEIYINDRKEQGKSSGIREPPTSET